jgi:uncharacterized protein YndB with AHSA1/START domain
MLPDIRHTVLFNAPIQKVWDAVATSEGIAAWWMKNDFQPKIGHEFTLESPYGPSPCKVLELDPPYQLTFAWDKAGWRVTFKLEEVEGKTKFTLIHSGWEEPDKIVPKASEKQSIIRDRMDKGWEMLVNNYLRNLVE